MDMNFRRILVLAPHTDDGELGAGGLIDKAIKSGSQVDYVAFSAAEDSVPEGFDKDCLRKEVLQATSHIGIDAKNVMVLNYKVRTFPAMRQEILDDLIKIRSSNNYDLVLIPSTTDIHQDHNTICSEAIRAFKNTCILGYELIWNQLTAASTCFVILNEDNVRAKICSMNEYKSQSGRAYCSAEFIRALAVSRGVQVGKEFAECFEVIRWVLK